MDRRRERKVVTVLFADLVGFTSRAERLDPEDVDAELSRYHAAVRHELERFGGTVEKFIGDAVMAVFGAPVAREDDPERAVRAALAVRDWARAEEALEVRIGVTTGEALIRLEAAPEAGEGMASGDVVNTAARLQAAAPPGGILVGERTYWATKDAVEYRSHEPVDAKGKALPVAVWTPVEARSRFGVDVEQAPRTTLVGRERELRLMRDAFERAREEREPQFVTLVGVPGIGKSRLLYELSRAFDADRELITWRQGRCLSYGDGVSFWALTEIVKAEAGILESDDDERAAAKLAASAQLAVPGEDTAWLERRLRPLLGLETEEHGTHGVREAAFPAWRRYLEGIAERGPTVLAFEDLHWGGDDLLEFLEEFMEWARGVPLLVVCTARPELLARRTGWGGGRTNTLTLSLRPLSDDETARVVHDLLERAVLPAELQRTLVERADGNPLYAEEFARMLADRGGEAVEVPGTVHGIIAARLDALPPEQKRLVHAAAVTGKVFWVGAVAHGADADEVEASLRELERRELVRRERRSSVADEVEYAFRHVLIRDVAYGQIPRSERSRLHRAAADWIAALGRPDDHADLLAHHYDEALEYARAAGETTVELERHALSALRDAGERAFALGAYPTAVQYFGRALELMRDDDEELGFLLARHGAAEFWADTAGEDALREAVTRLAEKDPESAARAALLLARIGWFRRDREGADRWLSEVVSLLAQAPGSIVSTEALVTRSAFHMTAGEHDEAVALAREALGRLHGVDRPDLTARAFDVIGCSRVGSGDDAGIEDQWRAVEIARRGRAIWEFHHALNNIGASLAMRGEVHAFDEHLELWRRGFDEIGATSYNRAWFAALQVEADYFGGRWDGALAQIESFLEGRFGRFYLEPQQRTTRALVELARDELDAASTDAERAVTAASAAGDRQLLAPAICVRALVRLALARADAADDVELLLADRRLAAGLYAELPQLAWAAVDAGRREAALEVLDGARPSPWTEAAGHILAGEAAKAADLLARTGDRPGAAYALLRAGGGGHLRRAVEFFSGVRATRYLREAEAGLTASA